ncbi:TPA: ATP-binding cassette domain-containing protein [Streptococcus pneumoniae]|nr:ATP-binding cassette domain-containing protein [Streptococcus pneumoniae]HEW7845541.1 ATP-binding cassette domain-containing protein [Streptococcus pneumoniae]
MAMIEVSCLRKDFVKIIKEPGLKGAIRSFIHPEKQIFEAVKDLSFEVPKGQILGFIGANGAGKSTTIKMLTGILKPTSGFCRINGKIPQENRQDYVKDIGVVFGQRTQLWWDLALQETYSVLKEIYDVPDAVFQKRMDFLNDVLDLKEFIKDPVRTLSLGQRMRADIAASLLHNPKVLFLDEPTIGLDVSVKDNIRRAITQINQEEETTILLTTHDLSDIEQLCDRIFMIDKGQEIFDGTVNQLKETFGKMKTLTFELRPGQNHVVSQFVGISDIHVTRKELLLNIQYDSSRYQTADIIQKTLSDFAIRDLKMTDVNIEDIIRRFYSKGALRWLNYGNATNYLLVLECRN